MSLIVVGGKLNPDDLAKAREHYKFYIKITADIRQGVVVAGGEYHADAEEVLRRDHGSRREDIWGGGFDLQTERFEVNAIINLRSGANESMDILDPRKRAAFLDLVKSKLKGIGALV